MTMTETEEAVARAIAEAAGMKLDDIDIAVVRAAIAAMRDIDIVDVMPQGEPVAWQWKTNDTWHTVDKTDVADPEAYAKAFGLPVRAIYAAPVLLAEGATCAKCGTPTKGEEALVGNDILCHPCADAAPTQPVDALKHLGAVLYMLANLHADDQCDAYVEALAFYNAACPDKKVAPVGGFSTRIVTANPIDAQPAAEAGVREALQTISQFEPSVDATKLRMQFAAIKTMAEAALATSPSNGEVKVGWMRIWHAARDEYWAKRKDDCSEEDALRAAVDTAVAMTDGDLAAPPEVKP